LSNRLLANLMEVASIVNGFSKDAGP